METNYFNKAVLLSIKNLIKYFFKPLKQNPTLDIQQTLLRYNHSKEFHLYLFFFSHKVKPSPSLNS